MKFIETCEHVFNEIQQLRRDVMSGKISQAAYALQLGGISLGEKHLKLAIKGALTERQLRRKLPVDLNRGTIEIEQERFECVDREMVITRADCLDYSGDNKNIEKCRSCKHFKVTRNLLIGEDEKQNGTYQ